MLTKDLADEVRQEVQRLKETQEQFLRTYGKLCVHYGKADWRHKKIELVFHRVRQEIVPIMEHAGMDAKQVEALCTWAEKSTMRR